MSEQESYSIKEMISEFRHDVNARFDDVDNAQAHTNGDVSNLKVWRGYITGGLAVVTLILVPLLVYVLKQSIDARAQLQTLNNHSQSYETNK